MKKIGFIFLIFVFSFATLPTSVSQAAEKGNLAIIKQWISKGGNINDIDKNNMTLLHIASGKGDLSMVKYLVSKGADVNIKADIFGQLFTPLTFAADKGHLDIVKYLISKGAIPSINDLDYSIMEGHLDIVKFLFPLIKNKDVNRLLKEAIKTNNLDIVKYLVLNGANINQVDKNDETPIFYAVRSNSLSIVKYLLSKGAKFKIKNKLNKTPIQIAEKKGYKDIVNHLHSKGGISTQDYKELEKAVKNNNFKLISKLLKKGININNEHIFWDAINDYGSILHLAIQTNCSKPMIKYLISKGADVNAKREDGETVLTLALDLGSKCNLDTIKYLISQGANVNAKNSLGETPLILACDYYNSNYLFPLIKYLISKGANVNAQRNDGWTPLELAVYRKSLKVVKYLISKGAKINHQDKYGNTPLHIATNSADIVKYLVSKGADVNIKNKRGQTPLSFAIREGDLNIIKYLVSKGAKITKNDINIITNHIYTCDPLSVKRGIFYSYLLCNHKDEVLSFLKKMFYKQKNASIKAGLSKQNKDTWKIKLFSKGVSRIDSIIQVKDGFLVSGGININGFIFKIDNNGKIIWKKIISTHGGVFGDKYKLIKIYNRLYILVFHSIGNQINLFALLDKNGNIIKKYDLDFIPTNYNFNKNPMFIGGMQFSKKDNKLMRH